MTRMAVIGRKPCGCLTFARWDEYKPTRWDRQARKSVASYPRGLNIQRVPLEHAHVVLCECD